VQLPPSFRLDTERLQRFQDQAQAAGRAPGLARLRLAFEFRHDSWFGPEARPALDVLARGESAFVCGHSSRYPYPESEPLTGDFRYLRFHGQDQMFASAYGKAGLKPWAPHMTRWLASGLDVFAYFNNDAGGHAVRDTQALLALILVRDPAGHPMDQAAATANHAGEGEDCRGDSRARSGRPPRT
jgi:uncharacterized protein YecE (DUF72 family)